MNQEMTDVPQYRQVSNAPSRSSEKDHYNKGYEKALLDVRSAMKTLSNRNIFPHYDGKQSFHELDCEIDNLEIKK